MALLEAKGLVKYYGRRKVVGGVDFEVNEGEIVGLLGPNGAGKTTSFRMTTGQISPHDGRVVFNGQDVTALPMYRRARLGMGYLAQETSVFRKLTVEQNILAILEAMPGSRSLGRKLSRTERWQRTEQVLERFGLNRVRKNPAARLSGGEKRRLEIARCLVCEPLLILLDEPFTGIDPKTIHDIQKIVLELRSTGICILLTDHNVRETLKITDRSYLIKDGVVRAHGTPQEIIRNPVAIEEYLGDSFADDVRLGPPPLTLSAPVMVGPPSAAGAPPPAAAEGGVHQLLEQEKIHRLVERLKSDDRSAASGELLRRGPAVVPALLEALERRDVDLRRHAFEVLRHLMGDRVAFDPFAPEAQRRQQIVEIRESCGRKAG